MNTATVLLDLKGADITRRFPGIAFMKDYNSYFEKRAKQIEKSGEQGVSAFHE